MGRSSQICDKLHLKILGQFHKNFPQCKTAKTMKIPLDLTAWVQENLQKQTSQTQVKAVSCKDEGDPETQLKKKANCIIVKT